MKLNKIRFLSLMLCIIMTLSSFSISASASESLELENANANEYSYATLVYSGDDTETYRIPITDPKTRSIYYLNVDLTGDTTAHTVTATLSNDFALGFSTVNVTLRLYSERYGTTLEDIDSDSDLNLGESISVTAINVTETAKFYATVTGTGNGENISYSTYHVPFNSRAAKYPTHITSPVTGASLPYNFSVTAAEIPESQWVKWNDETRDEYEDYLGEDLTGYHVHHILPRRYGGTNTPSNLIPLTPSDHSKVTNWWKYY